MYVIIQLSEHNYYKDLELKRDNVKYSIGLTWTTHEVHRYCGGSVYGNIYNDIIILSAVYN